MKYSFEPEFYHDSRKGFFNIFKDKIAEILSEISESKAYLLNGCIDNKTDKSIRKIVKYLIILDDNFYFKSMRKIFYKHIKELSKEKNLPKKIKFSYMELILKCDIELALSNNSKRVAYQKIPESIIKRMYDKLEYESFIKNFVLLFNVDNSYSLGFEALKQTKFEKKLLAHLIFSNILLNEIVNLELLEIEREKGLSQGKDIYFCKNDGNSINTDNLHENFNKISNNFAFKKLKNEFLKNLEIFLRKKIGETLKNNDTIINKIILNIKTKEAFLKDLYNWNNLSEFDKLISFESYDVQTQIFLNLILGIFNNNKKIIHSKEDNTSIIKNKASYSIEINKFISSLKEIYFQHIKSEFNKASNNLEAQICVKARYTNINNVKNKLNCFIDFFKLNYYFYTSISNIPIF